MFLLWWLLQFHSNKSTDICEHHFPLREAERKTRLSVGVLVITGGRVSAGDSPGSLSQAS